MPRAIADSDDEGSDDSDSGATNDPGSATLEPIKTDAHTPLDAAAATGTNSTGSTERLRRELHSAQRGFCATSTLGEMDDDRNQNAATPPERTGNKRRHTAIIGSEAIAVPSSGMKRAKTSFSTPEAQIAAEGSFARTSQTAMFTEHSANNSSALLPSLHADFVNHEPSVMFPHTGSTVADDSSAQQQMLINALKEDLQPSLGTSMMNDLESNGSQPSSLLWLESTGVSGSSAGKLEPPANARVEAAVEEHVAASTERPLKNMNSPVVEIRQPSRKVSSSSRTSRASRNTSPSTSKQRKRQAVEEEEPGTDPLNSDDRAIGLPKERYQPRPTRRRATEVHESVDLGVRPERAAKIKRVKTVDAAVSQSMNEDTAAKSDFVNEVVLKTTGSHKVVVDEEICVATKGSCVNPSQDAGKPSEEMRAGENVPEQNKSNAATGPEQKELALFATPAPPRAKKKSSASAKRAQTTIFEDHVEFIGSQRSPNLSQQQASRKAALKAAKKKRKAIVSDDEDDEIGAKEADNENSLESPPKKRGRGRSPKTSAKSTQKPAEKEVEDGEPDNETHLEDETVAKKAASDQPAKPTSESTHTSAENNETCNAGPPVDPQLEDNLQQKAPTCTPETNPVVNEIPTPSPEKENEAPKQQTSKGSPTSHSPIQNSSRVPLRVGLSKRQRIPSLLRVMRPPKL